MTWPPTTHQHVQDRVGPGVPVRAGGVGGLWYTPATTGSSLSASLDSLYAHALWLPSGTVTDLAVRVVTASAAGSGGLVRLGLYAHNVSTGQPAALLLDTGTASTELAGPKEFPVSLAVTHGLYWAAAVTQAVTSTLGTLTSAEPGVGVPSLSTSSPQFGWIRGSVSGALPASFTSTTPVLASTLLRVFYRMAA